MQQLKWYFTVSEEFLFIKDNQYLNLKLMLAVFSLGCATCGIFTYLITSDKNSAAMLNTLCVLAAFAIFPLAIINRNAFEHFTRILLNVGITLVGVLISLNVFMLLYKVYSGGNEKLRIYIPMVFFLFIFSIILCYYVAAAAYFLWTIVSKLCVKLFAFNKSEEGDGYEFKVRNSVLLKIIAVISTILALIAYVTPILSPVLEMFKDKT